MIQKGFDFQIAHYKEILAIKIKQLVSGSIFLTNKIIIIASELQESVLFHFPILMSSRQRQQPKSYLNSTLLYDIYHEHRSSSGKKYQMISYQEGFQAEQYLPTFLKSYKPPEKSSQVNPENADPIKRQTKQQISRPKQSIIFSAIQAKKGKDKNASSSNKQNHLNQILQSSESVGPKIQTSSSKNSQALNSHGSYLSSKQKFLQSKSQRIQRQKDFNFLSRTFHNAKKEQQNTEKQLLRRLSKKLEQEQNQRLKNSIKQKNMQLLNNQRIQNSTSKYMNHLMKYHAKKSLQQQNQKLAQTIREHSKSSTSLKTQRSVSTQKNLRQRAYLMKQSIRGNITQAKMISQSRIHKKSNSVREGMAQTYKCERIFQTWMIDQINKKNRHIAETIRTTRKNNSMLKNVLQNTKNADSNTLYGTLERAIKKNKRKTSEQL